MQGQSLASLSFVDIVLGPDYCDIKIEGPGHVQHQDISDLCAADVGALRRLCQQWPENESEFSLTYGDLRFRVTRMQSEAGSICFLSRIDAQIRSIKELPLTDDFVAFVLRPRLQGLILITGGFGTGKTTTASSLFSHRVQAVGGTGIAVEDPRGEVRMHGRHGQGRIIQIPVSKEGGYHGALQLVRRSRANHVLIGEIRDAKTAVEAQDIANTDTPAFATMHASSIEEAFDKYQVYLRSESANSSEANARLAQTIRGVIHLSKEYPPNGTAPRFISRSLLLDRDDPSCIGALSKIRDGQFAGLSDDIEFQTTRRLYGH